MMALTVSTAPTEFPVTLDEVAAFLGETKEVKFPEVEMCIRAVMAQLDGPEGLLNRALCTQTLQYTMGDFPGGGLGYFQPPFPGSAFDLPLPPLQSVSSITYLDTNGDSQTFSSSSYRVLNAGTPTRRGRVELVYGEVWPSTRSIEQAVTVTYVAGYGARNAVPDYTRYLILLMCKAAYDFREPYTAPTNLFESPALKGLFAQAQFPAVA